MAAVAKDTLLSKLGKWRRGGVGSREGGYGFFFNIFEWQL